MFELALVTSAIIDAENRGLLWCGLTKSVTTVCRTSMGGKKSMMILGKISTMKVMLASGPCRSLTKRQCVKQTGLNQVARIPFH